MTPRKAAEAKTLEHKTWTEYIGRLWFVRTRVTRHCVYYKNRTKRGKMLFTHIWAKRYPYLFTKDFLKELRGGAR